MAKEKHSMITDFGEEALAYVHRNFLIHQKEYAAPHGLGHIARIQVLARMVFQFNLKHAHQEIREYLKVQTEVDSELFIAKVQVALAFYDSGYNSEMAESFKKYVVAAHLIPKLFCNQDEVDTFATCLKIPCPIMPNASSVEEHALTTLFYGAYCANSLRWHAHEEIRKQTMDAMTKTSVAPLDPEVQDEALSILGTAARLTKQMGYCAEAEYDVEACIDLLNHRFDYTPNTMKARNAFRTRSNVDSRDFNAWYHNTDMERIIWAQYERAEHKEAYLEPYVFYDNYGQSFDDTMQLADKYFRASKKFYFPFVIKPELGSAHYIAGIIRKEEKGQNTCFIFNPLGYKDVESKENAKKRLDMDSIHFVGGMQVVFSSHTIQSKEYDGENLKSCGPLCAAFIDYALNHPEWVKTLDSTFLLPSHLMALSRHEKEAYVAYVCALRKEHDNLLGMVQDSDLELIDDFYQRPNQYFIDSQTKWLSQDGSEDEDNPDIPLWQSGEEDEDDNEDSDAALSDDDSDFEKYCNNVSKQCDENPVEEYPLEPLDGNVCELPKKKEASQVATKQKLDPFDKVIRLLPQDSPIGNEIDKLRQYLTALGNNRKYNQIAKKTKLMVEGFLNKENNAEQKLQVMDVFQKEVLALLPKDSAGVIVAKIVAAIIIMCVVTTIIALAGMGIGMVAGLWTGFGAIPAAFAGTLGGIAFGAAVGVTVAASVTGVSLGAFSAYALFKPAAAERQVQVLVEEAKEAVNMQLITG